MELYYFAIAYFLKQYQQNFMETFFNLHEIKEKKVKIQLPVDIYR